MSESNIRLSRPTDISNLVTLDLKTYPYPLTMDQWQKLVKSSGQEDKPRVVVIEVGRKPVGFATWVMKEDYCWIVRLGVLKTFGNTPGTMNYRRKGLGTRLVDQCVMEAVRNGKKKLRILIPEHHCIPDDPDNVVGFLNSTDFQPTGEISNDFGVYYGEMKDAYVFERKV